MGPTRTDFVTMMVKNPELPGPADYTAEKYKEMSKFKVNGSIAIGVFGSNSDRFGVRPDLVPGPGQYVSEGIGSSSRKNAIKGTCSSTYKSVTDRDLKFIKDKSKFLLFMIKISLVLAQ